MPRLFDYLKTPYPEEFKSLHAAGIQAVSLANWATLQNIAAQLEKSELATCKVRERLKQLKQKMVDRPSDVTSHRERLHWSRLLRPGYLKWQQHHIAQLNDPRWWQQCFETAKSFSSEKQHAAEITLRELQATWSVQSAYAHYSTIDLIHVYQAVMPVFAEWLQDAQREWLQHAHRFTTSQQRAYQTYLTEFEAALVEEKQRLRACLQGRLKVGIQKGNGTRDNLLDALRDKLKSIGLLAPNPRIEKALAYGHLTPQAFVAIEAIFQQDGSESEKQAFFALPYYCPRVDNSADFNKHKEKMLSQNNRTHLPSRSDVMPDQPPFYRRLPRFLHWLFWDEQVNDQFFRRAEHRSLQWHENAFLVPDRQSPLLHLDYDAVWQTGQTALNDLITERERVRYWLAHPLAFFFPSTVKRLVDYAESLAQRADMWVARQLRIVMDVMAAKANQPFNEAEKAALEKAMRGLQAAKTQWQLSPATLSTLNQFEISYAQVTPSHTEPRSSDDAAIENLTHTMPRTEQLNSALLQAIEVFESTHTVSDSIVLSLKKALQADAALCDKRLLRLQVRDYLKQLPPSLQSTLQAILDQPQFSQVELNVSPATTFHSIAQPCVTSLVTMPFVEATYPALDENPWDYAQSDFVQHRETLKSYTLRHEDNDIVLLHQKLRRYTLGVLKHIVALSDWDDFIRYRHQITDLLETLAEVTNIFYPALHNDLVPMLREIESLHSGHWEMFKKRTLGIEIRVLERLLDPSRTLHNPTVLYTPPKEGGFFKVSPELTRCSSVERVSSLPHPI